MSNETLPLSITRTDKPPTIMAVLKKYYPEVKLGKCREPLLPIRELLREARISFVPNTLTQCREGSLAKDSPEVPRLAEVLLLNALLKDKNWETPSVKKAMEVIAKTGKFFQEKSVWNIRRSEGLTPAIAERLDREPEEISRLIRGIRVDGALIALENPEAWKKLKEITQKYADDYESLPPSMQRNPEMVDKMKYAKSAKELYGALYGSRENVAIGRRRIAGFVPYELEYWQWLIDSGIVDSYQHLPFSMATVKVHAFNLDPSLDSINTWVKGETNIVSDRNVTGTRMRLIRNDLPKII